MNCRSTERRFPPSPRPANVCARSCATRLVRRQERLRRGRLRRMHGLGRRKAGAQLPLPGVSRRGQDGHDDRGARARRQAASDAAGVSRRAGLSMRLLHGRHDHDGRDVDRRTESGSAAGAEGQSVPLHGLRAIRDAIAGMRRRARRRRQARGASVPNPFARDIVTGHARYTLDIPPPDGMLHLKVLRSPHAHARITRSTETKALAVPGVVDVFTWEDVPRKLYTTAIHEDNRVDPDDTYMLDNVARFVGQRIAAVVAETEGAAEEGCRSSKSSTRSCRPCSIRKKRWCPVRRCCTTRASSRGRCIPSRTSSSTCTARSAALATGFEEADADARRDVLTRRASSTSISKRCSRSRWRSEDGRFTCARVRKGRLSSSPSSASSSAQPGRRARVYRARRRRLRRQARDDQRRLAVLATLKTGRPVMWEFTREEQFTGATTRIR